MVRKGSAPWSLDKEAGRGDAPVNSHPVVTRDKVNATINAGYIDGEGEWQLDRFSDDKVFTFQDPAQALGPGADLEFFVNMLNHDIMILALLDSSGNNINVDVIAYNPTTLEGPYNAKPFQDTAVNGAQEWMINKSTSSGFFQDIIKDTAEDLNSSWEFFKVIDLRGTQLRMVIHNNEGADAGTISTAYLRLI
jgi:hypothetical protein